jgi:DNA polymerase-3 subunit epsilon
MIIKFLNFCEDAIIVGHFISLDITFINRELKNAIKQKIENPLLDTVAIYDWIENHRLRTIGYDEIMSGEKDLFLIAKKYNITISESHNALIDAFITAQLFQRFLIQLQTMGIVKVKDLLKIGSP